MNYLVHDFVEKQHFLAKKAELAQLLVKQRKAANACLKETGAQHVIYAIQMSSCGEFFGTQLFLTPVNTETLKEKEENMLDHHPEWRMLAVHRRTGKEEKT